MRRALIVLALAACQRDNHVALKLGALDGFICDDPATGAPLYDRAQSTGQYAFIIYVDILAFHATTPSCFGQDIVAACNRGDCSVAASACVALELSGPLTLGAVQAKLSETGDLFGDAPDGPVLVRAVAVADQTCPADGSRPTITADNIIGCVYSCPEVLDDISGDLELQLGLLGVPPTSPACEQTVVACAQLVPGT